MYYSEEIIEEVQERNDIVSVISEYVKLTRKGNSYFGLCPFHNEKTPSFSVSPDKQMYYCFGCGAGGNVIRFIMEYENLTFQEAVRFLADRAGMSLPEEEESSGKAKKNRDLKNQIYEVNSEAAKFYHRQLLLPEGKRGLEYLKGRALTDETITHFGLGFAGQDGKALSRHLKGLGYSDEVLVSSGLVQVSEREGMSDRFWNRVMFPIMDINRKVIAFGGRVMGDAKPKYLNTQETPVFDKSRNLYGLNFARSSRTKKLLLCEGYMDVISLHQAGFTNAVASLGTSMTSGHAAILKRYADEVILTYDSDEAGIKAAQRAIALLKDAGVPTRVLHMDPCKDPDEFIKTYGAGEFQKRIDEAESSFQFELSVMERSHDMKDPDDKTRFYREVAEKIAESDQEIERENYIEATADRYHVSFKAMRDMVNGILMKGGPAPKREPRTLESKKEKEDGILISERLLLTWLSEDPSLFPKVSEYVRVEDFEEGIYREVAALLYEQLLKGTPNVAQIADHFAETDEESTVARIFNTTVPVDKPEEKEKAVHDTVRKIMEHAIEVKSASNDPADMKSIQELMNERKRLEAFDHEVIVTS